MDCVNEYSVLEWKANLGIYISSFFPSAIQKAKIKICKYIYGPGELCRSSDWLRDGRSGDRILVVARFYASVQTGPWAYPSSYTMGTGSFPGVKQPGRGVNHTTPFSAEVKERVELYLYSSFGPSWPELCF